MGPTWSQHGVQEGSKIGPRGVKLLSRGGHQLRLLSDRSHGPHMDPKCTPNEPQVGVMLGSSWGRLGVILGSSWGHLGVILGSLWDHFEVTLGSHWDHIGVTLEPFWYQRFSPKCRGADLGSRIKISGHLLGQNDQHFEIYPFRLVLGNQKGLAAEGEALRIILYARICFSKIR